MKGSSMFLIRHKKTFKSMLKNKPKMAQFPVEAINKKVGNY